MPIAFDCACGKSFRVGDELAGKRTKCPGCGAALTVPAPAATDEDAAYQALTDGPDPEPAPRAPSYEPPNRPDPPKTKPTIQAQEMPRAVAGAPRAREYEPPPSPRDGIHISSGVLGGCAMMAGAAIWFGVGWAAGVIYFYPPILFVFGLVAVVRGLLGHSED